MQRILFVSVAAFLAISGLGWVCGEARGQSGLPKRVDTHGDPLPTGALARLGTVRWRHGGVTGFAAFLPDGKTVISSADDRLVRVWDYPSGKEIRRFGPGMKDDLPNAVGRVVYYGQTGAPVALTPDGKTVACNFEGGDVLLFDVATGKERPALKSTGNFRSLGYSSAMEFSPDGQHLAVLEHDSSIRLWDWAGAKEIRQFNVPQLNNAIFGGYPAITWSPDGKLLATVNLELVNNMVTYSVKLWDPEAGKEVRTIALPQNVGGASPHFSPDGKMLAFACFDGTVNLMDVETGKEIRKIRETPNRGMLGVSFAKSGKTLYTRAINDVGFREYDVATGKELRQIGMVARQPRNRVVYGVSLMRPAFSPNGDVLVLTGVDNALHFIDLASGKEVHGEGGHPAPVLSIQFSKDGKSVWTHSDDPTIRQWDAASGKELTGVPLPTNSLNAALSRDGKYVVTQPIGVRGIQVLDVASGKPVGAIQPPPRGFYADMAFSPDATTLVVRFQQGANKIDLYDLPRAKALPGFFGFVSKDAPVFTRFEQTPIQLRRSLNIVTGYPEPGAMVAGPITIAPPTMIFSADGQTLAAYSDPTTLALWDTATGKKLTTLPLANRVQIQSGSFSLDGRCLALDMNDGTVALWELASGKERRVFGTKILPSQKNVRTVVNYGGSTGPGGERIAFSPDSRQLVHAGYDRVVRVWDVATGTEVAGFRGHSGTINAVAFAPDGKTLASASNDTTALIWDLGPAQSKVAKRDLPTKELEARWQELQGGDAQKAFAAICDLIAAPDGAVACLKGHLQPAPALDLKLVTRLIANLDDSVYRVRQKATAELLKLGERAVPSIQQTLAANPPLEVKKRLEDVNEKLTTAVLTDEKLRLYRAIEVLERIGTAEAREVLQSLADGAPGAFATMNARAALARQGK